jgi:hypothetical protein
MKANLVFDYLNFVERIVNYDPYGVKLMFRTLAKCSKTYFK